MSKITKVELDGMRGTLIRERDGAGDCGYMSSYNRGAGPKSHRKYGFIEVGHSVFCGAIFTSTFGADTYWITTPVTEILEVNEAKTKVQFKTGNSIYTFTTLGHKETDE